MRGDTNEWLYWERKYENVIRYASESIDRRDNIISLFAHDVTCARNR